MNPALADPAALSGKEPAKASLAALSLIADHVHSRQTLEVVDGELQDSERRFRQMIDALPAAIYTTDPQGRVTHFNPACVEFSGRTPQLGNDQWCVSWKLYHADGTPMPHDECPMAIALKEGRILRGVEAILERPDGTRRWFTPYPTALRDSEGKVIGGINMLVDITERKQAETTRASLAAIVESSEDAIISKDLNGIITSWNKGAERLFGYTAEEAVGKSVTLLIPPDRQHEEPRILERLRRGERVEHFETVRVRKDGSRLEISLTISPVRDSSGRTIGASKIARDITERKRGEQLLAQAQAQLADRTTHLETLVAERTARLQETIGELEHFSYTITHDMRAPLRAMQGFCRLLQEDVGDQLPPQSADHLRRVMEGSRRMDALIRDSLQYTRVVRERIPLAPVKPLPLLRGILETYPNLQPSQVQIEILEPLPAVIANETGLAQCFANLLSNAVKFVKPGTMPHVRIWAEIRSAPAHAPLIPGLSPLNREREESELRTRECAAQKPSENSLCSSERAPSAGVRPNVVRLWFEDNGIGILQKYQDRIFSMFQQLDRGYEGTGIGLALVRKTAERMDGKTGVESERGKGSRFWLEFKQAPVSGST